MINDFYLKKVLRLVEQDIVKVEDIKEPYKVEVIKILEEKNKQAPTI